jgi:hypothetical protein
VQPLHAASHGPHVVHASVPRDVLQQLQGSARCDVLQRPCDGCAVLFFAQCPQWHGLSAGTQHPLPGVLLSPHPPQRHGLCGGAQHRRPDVTPSAPLTQCLAVLVAGRLGLPDVQLSALASALHGDRVDAMRLTPAVPGPAVDVLSAFELQPVLH